LRIQLSWVRVEFHYLFLVLKGFKHVRFFFHLKSPQKHLVSWIVRLKAQSIQALKWLECLMFIPISQWLQRCGLSIVNFTDSWDFVFVRSFFLFQMVSLIVFLKAKGNPLKVLLKRTRGLFLKEKFLFGISAFGIFRMILLQVL